MNGRNVRRYRRALIGYILILPLLIGILLFFLIPFCINIRYSFTFGVGGAEFVGVKNYISVLSSEAFRLAAGNTLCFLCIGIPLIIVVSFFLALFLKSDYRWCAFLRSILLLPLVLPLASVVMVFQIIFNSGGLLNDFLQLFEIHGKNWLNSPMAFWILILLYLWKNTGYDVILMLSGLNLIPDEFYQSAKLDGAGFLTCLWYITLPMMRPFIRVTFIVSIVNSFKIYREAFILGGEYPHDSIYMLQHFLNSNFRNMNLQRLSVASILLFLFILIFAVPFLYYKTKHIKEEV